MFNKFIPANTSAYSYWILFGWLLSMASPSMATTPTAEDKLLACPGLTLPDTIRETIFTCSADYDICLGISTTDMANYTITDNGTPYAGGMQACDFDTSVVYSYSGLTDGGANGPYTVDAWQVNSSTFMGSFNSVTELVDSLNSWDPAGNWMQDAPGSLLQGGDANNTYGDIFITQTNTNIKDTLEATVNITPNGSILSVDTGYHEIILDNAVLGCRDTLYAIINCITCPYVYAGSSSIEVDDCDSAATVCLEIPFNDLSAYSISVNNATYAGPTAPCEYDSIYTYDFSALFAEPGPYLLQGWQVNGSSFLGSFNNISHLVDSMNAWDPAANWTLNFSTSTIDGGQWSSTYSDINIRLINNTVIILSLDTLPVPRSTQIELAVGSYDFEVRDLNSGCSDIFTIEVSCDDGSGGFSRCGVYSGALDLMTDDCSTPAAVCTNIPMDEWNDYLVFLNGVNYSGNLSRCGNVLDTMNLVYALGLEVPPLPFNFDLLSWSVNGSVYTASGLGSYAEMVDSMNVWDAGANWMMNQFNIEGGNLNNTYGNLVLNVGANSPNAFSPDPITQPIHASMELDTGRYQILFLNPTALCTDTVNMTVQCRMLNCPDVVSASRLEVDATNCDDVASVCLDVDPADWGDYSVELNGRPFTDTRQGCQFVTTGYSFSLSFLPSADPSDEFSINFWFINGQDYSGTFRTANDLLILLQTWDPAANWTYDAATNTFSTTNPNGTYTSVPVRPLPMGALNLYRVNTDRQATATSIDLPVGEHLLVFGEGSTGCEDSVRITVNCPTLESSTFRDTIDLMASDTLCIATAELPGPPISINNICADGSGEFVLFELLTDEYCVVYTAIEEGVDSACIVICDDLNNCDTTYLFITVEDNTVELTPVAGVDTSSIIQGQVAILNVLANDEPNGSIDSLYIVQQPSNGLAILNVDSTITYTPNEDFCNSTEPDVLTYAICNANGCDTAQVTILVYCNSIHAFSGFSPNNDGTNDTFVIEGLQDYPDHRVSVFNRWGNQVYTVNNYDNDNGWDGTFNGINLPDGTYFYTIEASNGIVKSGYVQLRR
ncbi:MAG: gliding motility-associated C-terminal domain-containing protein [Bacteroidota bacterium]